MSNNQDSVPDRNFEDLPEDAEELLVPERAERLMLTVGRVWREGRVSCPHGDLLRAHQDGSLTGGQADYITWHVNVAECPYCMAYLDEIEASEKDAGKRQELDQIKERLLSSTMTFLESKRG